MKKQIVFEDVKLGAWNEVGYYLCLSNGIKNELNDCLFTIQLNRKKQGGYSNIENLVLTLNSDHPKQFNIGVFPWGSECKFRVEGIKNLESISANQYVYLDKLIISY